MLCATLPHIGGWILKPGTGSTCSASEDCYSFFVEIAVILWRWRWVMVSQFRVWNWGMSCHPLQCWIRVCTQVTTSFLRDPHAAPHYPAYDGHQQHHPQPIYDNLERAWSSVLIAFYSKRCPSIVFSFLLYNYTGASCTHTTAPLFQPQEHLVHEASSVSSRSLVKPLSGSGTQRCKGSGYQHVALEGSLHKGHSTLTSKDLFASEHQAWASALITALYSRLWIPKASSPPWDWSVVSDFLLFHCLPSPCPHSSFPLITSTLS